MSRRGVRISGKLHITPLIPPLPCPLSHLHAAAILTPRYSHVREQTHLESLHFMREQRIRILLSGSWFPIPPQTAIHPHPDPTSASPPSRPSNPRITDWRFVRLAPNRRHLHHGVFTSRPDRDPQLLELGEKLDLDRVTSVVSNVTASDVLASTSASTSTPATATATSTATGRQTPNPLDKQFHRPTTTTSTFPSKPASPTEKSHTVTTLSIRGSSLTSTTDPVLLFLHTASSSLASEWLDGLLMLLDQQPITAETGRLVSVLENWSLRVRMLGLRWEDVEGEGGEEGDGVEVGMVLGKEVPSREGTEEGFWYAMGEE